MQRRIFRAHDKQRNEACLRYRDGGGPRDMIVCSLTGRWLGAFRVGESPSRPEKEKGRSASGQNLRCGARGMNE